MKRIIVAALVLMMLTLPLSCGKNIDPSNTTPSPVPTKSSVPTASPVPTTAPNDKPSHMRSEWSWGMGEFIKDVNGGNSPLSSKLGEDGLEQYIQHPQFDVQTGKVTFYLEEVLFDGRQVNAVFTVIPNDVSKTLLMTNYGYSPEDTIFYASGEPSGAEQTFGDKAAAEGKELLTISVFCSDDDILDGIYTEQYHTDGSVTLFVCQNFSDTIDEQRPFRFEFSESKTGSGQVASVERELVLSPCGEWEEASAVGSEVILGATVSAKYVRNQFEALMTYTFVLSADISSADLEEWTLIYVDQYDADTKDKLNELGSGVMMLDSEGNSVSTLSAGDSVVIFISMQADTALPKTMDVKLVRALGDGSEAGSIQLSFS